MKPTDEKRSRAVSARVPAEMAEQIEQLARENTRTVSLQIEHLLKLALELVAKAGGIDHPRIVREVSKGYAGKKSQ